VKASILQALEDGKHMNLKGKASPHRNEIREVIEPPRTAVGPDAARSIRQWLSIGVARGVKPNGKWQSQEFGIGRKIVGKSRILKGKMCLRTV
jgi:hypothetical protein